MKLLKYLTEKQIVINNGQRYGQVVFLAGGGSSGKGHVVKNYMEGDKFKIIDVDEWKKEFLDLNTKKHLYPELDDLNLRNPSDVFKLHHFVKEKGIRYKVLDLIFRERDVNRLPNLIFDITMKDDDEVNYYLPQLIDMGYESKNIHVVWVLADFNLALERNRDRERVVPDDIILKTHSDVPVTIIELLRGKFRQIDGSIVVVLNDPKFETYYTDDKGNPITNTKGSMVIKDFKYIVMKEPGKGMVSDKKVKEDLLDSIRKYIPKTRSTKDLFSLDIDTLY